MMIYKKLIILICLVLVAFQYISAQAPRPYWAKNAIQAPESGKYIFVYGEGNGKTQEESRKKAFADAVVKGQYELGSVTISAQDIAAIENGGLDAAMRFTNRQIKITCQTDPVIDGGLYKAFVLIQMSIDADKSARFYDLPQNWDCVDNNYIYELAQYNRQNEKLKKEREKENKRNYERERRRERRDRLWSDSYEYSNYFSFAFGNGINYGGCNLIGAQLTKRIGGICGIEPHIGNDVFNSTID